MCASYIALKRGPMDPQRGEDAQASRRGVPRLFTAVLFADITCAQYPSPAQLLFLLFGDLQVESRPARNLKVRAHLTRLELKVVSRRVFASYRHRQQTVRVLSVKAPLFWTEYVADAL